MNEHLLGSNETVSTEVVSDTFVCEMYGNKRVVSVNEFRYLGFMTLPIFIMGFGSVKIDTHLRQGSTRNLIFSCGQGGISLMLISYMLKFQQTEAVQPGQEGA